MATLFSLFSYLFFQGIGFVLLVAFVVLFVFWSINKFHSRQTAFLFALLAAGWLLLVVVPVGMPNLAQYPFSLKTFGPGIGPVLSASNVVKFFFRSVDMERVNDIAWNPTDIPPPITRTEARTVKLKMTAKEVIGEMAPGVLFNYWTFDGKIPGPFLRVREGDTVELTLFNDPTSIQPHNIDLHAVTGPGGGGAVTNVAPGEEKMFTFKALNPGLYVYHCAHPNIASHMAHGMYGLILVEPKEGLSKVDKEFYVMQGEFYSKGGLGNKGIQVFDASGMLDGKPEYIVFNGRINGVVGNMNANVGEKIRMFVGNGGVNLISSFHIVGEIFDTVYPEGAIGSEPHTNIQTTLVPAGGASMVEFGLEVPGKYVLVDHALARMDRGAWGTLEVSGDKNPSIFDGIIDESHGGH